MENSNKKNFRIKTKTWIENDQKELLFGKGKTEILQYIELEGSIAKAAEKMNLNYKKAWTHIKILQKNIDDRMVIPQKGGKGTGGTRLTPTAKSMIVKYQQLQQEIESFANQRFQELFFPQKKK